MRLFLILAAVAFWMNSEAQPIVGLSVKERAGIARINEPVLCGVPLPESLYTDINAFALKDASGNVIPCEFRTAAKWWRDKQSIRWLHIDFKTDLAANEDKKLALWIDPASHAITGSKLKVTDLGTKYQVDTGPLRFTVKKAGFNLFDEVWVDESGSGTFDAAHQVVQSHTKGFSHLLSGTRYYASNDQAPTAVVERQGPNSLVIKVEGRLKNAGGQNSFWFQSRIYAYNNSKEVKVTFAWELRTSDIFATQPLHGLNLELPVNGSSRQFLIGAKTAPKSGTLQSAEEAFLLINGIDKYRYGGVLSDSGNTKLDQNPDWGWAALKDGTKGVAVGVKWFWQNYPSSIEVNGAGLLNVGLFSHRFTGGSTAYPPRQPNHFLIYPGMSKTHELRFVFFNDDADAEIRSEVAGAMTPAYAFSTPAWYCRATHAFGEMVEYNNPSLYTPIRWNQLKTYETAVYNGALKCIGNTGAVYGGKDAYDYLAWGDNPHQLWQPGWLMWNGNYYDMPNMIVQGFVRTLDYRLLDYFDAHAAHIQDLHLTHFESNDPKDGSNRYCPFTNHIGADTTIPDVQTHTSHHKTQSLWEKYYLLGDDRALDMAFRGLAKIKSYGTSMNSDIVTYLRRPAHVIFTLTMAYKHTLASPEYAALQSELADFKLKEAAEPTPGQNWMVGMITEALIDAYQITADTAILRTVKSLYDKVNNPGSVGAFGLAYIANYYNAPAYFNRISSQMTGFGNGVTFGHHERDYVEQGRSLNRLAYYFAIADSAKNRNVNTGVGIENSVSAGEPAFALFPNPFYSAAVIAVPAGTTALKIYDARGRLVENLTPRLTPKTRDLHWGRKGLSRGVYLVRLFKGKKSVTRKLTFLG